MNTHSVVLCPLDDDVTSGSTEDVGVEEARADTEEFALSMSAFLAKSPVDPALFHSWRVDSDTLRRFSTLGARSLGEEEGNGSA